jgi:hypothetical protein
MTTLYRPFPGPMTLQDYVYRPVRMPPPPAKSPFDVPAIIPKAWFDPAHYCDEWKDRAGVPVRTAEFQGPFLNGHRVFLVWLTGDVPGAVGTLIAEPIRCLFPLSPFTKPQRNDFAHYGNKLPTFRKRLNQIEKAIKEYSKPHCFTDWTRHDWSPFGTLPRIFDALRQETAIAVDIEDIYLSGLGTPLFELHSRVGQPLRFQIRPLSDYAPPLKSGEK